MSNYVRAMNEILI